MARYSTTYPRTTENGVDGYNDFSTPVTAANKTQRTAETSIYPPDTKSPSSGSTVARVIISTSKYARNRSKTNTYKIPTSKSGKNIPSKRIRPLRITSSKITIRISHVRRGTITPGKRSSQTTTTKYVHGQRSRIPTFIRQVTSPTGKNEYGTVDSKSTCFSP